MALPIRIRDKWNNKKGITTDEKFGTAPYKSLSEKVNVSAQVNANAINNPKQQRALNQISGKTRNAELRANASRYAERKRDLQYQEKWYKGEEPTTAEFYSAIRKAADKNKEKAEEIANGFLAWQNDPNSEYYEPYLYKMTNTSAAQGIYDLLGVDISGGITQEQINELKQYADYSNRGMSGTPLDSKAPAQKLAYLLYNLEKDESVTQQAELELKLMQEDIQHFVDKGYSDEYIVSNMDMSRYPTISKMQSSAAMGAVTPLNRPIGYSKDYVYGAIWAARNGGSTGKTAEDIANWHDKVGKHYVPNEEAEAARDPQSDNFNPYSLGPTIELNREEVSASKKKTAEEATKAAKKELDSLKKYVLSELKTRTADEVYEELTSDNMSELEEYYPTLAKMELARRDGSYILLTDTVDFALPYFKKWIDAQYADGQKIAGETLKSSTEYLGKVFGSLNGGGSSATQEQEKTVSAPSEEPVSTNTTETTDIADSTPVNEKDKQTVEEKETAVETPVQGENKEAPIEEKKEEVLVVPNPNFNIRDAETDDRLRTDLWSGIYNYRRGMPVTDENVMAFIQKYPYLFGGEVGWMNSVRGENGELIPLGTVSSTVDTRTTVLKNGMYAGETELGKTGAELLKRADAAQSNGDYSQYEYVILLMTLASEIENAKENGVTFEQYINTEGTSANDLLKETNETLIAKKAAKDAIRKQEVLDYGNELHNLRTAYESGNFDRIYVIVKNDEERAIAQENPENNGKYIWTEEERDKWQQLIEESYTTIVTGDDVLLIDPKKYYTKAMGMVYTYLDNELEYIDEYNDMDDYTMYGAKNSVRATISNRVKTRLQLDLGLAKAAGITIDEYYNSIGYANDYGVKSGKYRYIGDYVEELVVAETEAWQNLEITAVRELADAVTAMEEYEFEDDTNVYNFTEEEIQAVLDDGGITEEQANLIRMYNEVNYIEGKQRSWEEIEGNAGIDGIRTAMYDKLAQISSEQLLEQQGFGKSQSEATVGLVGNRTDGKASLGYVIKTSADLGATEHKKSWLETWYGLARNDSSGIEREYRSRFTREEVRANILNTIDTISDADLKEALLNELEVYSGDIYDFNYDFTVEHILEKIRATEQKIEFIQNEVAQYCTQGQANAIEAGASMVDTTLTMLETIGLNTVAVVAGVPPVGAQVLASVGTTGLRSAGETINTLMDADISKDKALAAGFVSGAMNAAIELSLDRIVGLEGKISKLGANKGRRSLGAYMGKEIEGEASEGFLKAVMQKLPSMPVTVAAYTADKIGGGLQEAAEELLQDISSTVVTNTALDLEGKGQYKDNLTWDEVGKIVGTSFFQGMLLDAGSDIVLSSGGAVKSLYQKQQQNNRSANRIFMQETVSTLELQKAQNHLKEVIENGTLEEKLNDAETIADIEMKAAEIVTSKADEIKNSPAYEKKKAAEKSLSDARTEWLNSVTVAEDAQAMHNEARNALAAAEIPDGDVITAFNETKAELDKAQETLGNAEQKYNEANEAYENARADFESQVKAIAMDAETEARSLKAQEIKEEQVRLAEEEVRRKEEESRTARERLEAEIQETTGATDAEMEKVRKKADKLIDTFAKAQMQIKESLKNRLEVKLPNYKVRYDDTADAQAGWVVRTNGKREIVLNGNVDANVLATAVAAHELAHVAQDSKYYDALKKSVFDIEYYGDTDGSGKQADIDSLKQDYAKDGITLNDAQAEFELVAELLAEKFGNNKAWVDSLIAEQPNLVVRLYDWVSEKVGYLKTLVTQGKEAAEAYRLFNTMKNTFAKAITDAGIRKDVTIDNSDDGNYGQDIPAETRTESESPREFALRRRVEATARTKTAARLMNAADVYRAAGDWRNYNRAIELLYNLGNTERKLSRPHAIMKGLAQAFGIGVYEGSAPDGMEFSKYDNHTGALKIDRNSELDVAFSMYAIGEKIKKMTGITDPSENYALADFLYGYMMNPDKRLPRMARQYNDTVFRPALEKMGAEFVNAMQTARDELTAFRNSSSAEKVNAYIVSRSDKEAKSFGNTLREMTVNLIDQTYAAEVVDMITGGHQLRKAATYLPYAKRRADTVISGDTFVDLDGNDMGGYTLKTALKDIKKSELDVFQSYLIAREAISRFDADPGRPPFKSAMTYEDAVNAVEDFESNYPHFVDSARRYDEWWNNVMLTYVVAEGFLTPEEYNRMRTVHPHYVSFAREGTKSYKVTFAKGNSDLPIIAPLESAILMVNQFVDKAAQNRFARVFDEMYKHSEDLGFIATELKEYASNGQEVRIKGEDSLEVNSATPGIDVTNATDAQLKALAGTHVYADDAKYGNQVLTVHLNDGTTAKYVLHDKALFDLLSGCGRSVQNKALRAIGTITRFMTRATTGINLLFIVSNASRDFQKSVNYGSWANTYLDGMYKWLKMFVPTLLDKGEALEGYKNLGGGGWSVARVTKKRGRNTYKNVLFRDDRSFRELSGTQRIGRILQYPMRLVERLGEAVETTSRLVEYQYGKHDLTTLEGRIDAFMAAQEVTVDFERGGKNAQLLRTFVPFANATIQGAVQNVRMFTDAEKSRLAPRLAKSAFNSMLLGAVSAIWCKKYMADNEDERKYDELTDEWKRDFVLFPFLSGGSRDFFRLPVSQDWATRIFYELGRQLGSGEYRDDGFGAEMLSLAKDLLLEPISEATTIVSPLLDVSRNLKWNDSPVVSQSLERYAPEGRYNDTTPEVFRMASRIATNVLRMVGAENDSRVMSYVTPNALEYLTQQYTGVYGQLVIPALSFDRHTGEMNPLKSMGTAVINRFTTDADSYNRVTNDYYTNSAFVDEFLAHAKNKREYSMNPDLTKDDLEEIFREIDKANKNGGYLYDLEKRVQQHNENINTINADTTLTDRQKADLSEAEMERRNQVMRDYNEYVESFTSTLFDGWIKTSREIVTDANIATLPKAFRDAYDNGETYILEALRLKNGGTTKSVLPMPTYKFTNGDFVKEEYREEFDEWFRNAYAKALKHSTFGTEKYNALDDDEKADFFSKLRSEAQAKAKKTAEQKNWIEESK